ncbi:MAG: alpha/beta hydrolase [Planctomycetales bacterium]|nr:alpha/beta hydrolase [Planctomycetales bacterium]
MILLCAAIVWTVANNPTSWAAEKPENDGSNVATETLPRQDDTEFGVQKTSDIQFCDHSPQINGADESCDLYLPLPARDAGSGGGASNQQNATSNADPQPCWPVVLVVHGGGWATGTKWTMDRHARQLAKNGFAVVSINYRLAPTSKFPDQVDDVRSALVWITEHAETYSLDTDRVGLYGYSAGGHLVSLVATLADEPWSSVRQTTSWPKDDARWQKIPKIRAVCIGGPPTDFRNLPLDNTALSFFLGGSRRERPDVYTAASPIVYTSPTDPPFQIIHGEADGIVPVDNAKDFHQALVKSNVPSTLHTLPGKGHLMAFISPQLTQWMLGFFEEQLSKR